MEEKPREQIDAIAYLIKLKALEESRIRQLRELKKENKKLKKEIENLRRSRDCWRDFAVSLVSNFVVAMVTSLLFFFFGKGK